MTDLPSDVRAYMDAAMRHCAEHGPSKPTALSRAAGYDHHHDHGLDDLPPDASGDEIEARIRATPCTADTCPAYPQSTTHGMVLWIHCWAEGLLLQVGPCSGGGLYRPRGEEPAVQGPGAGWYTPERSKAVEREQEAQRLLDLIYPPEDNE